MRQEVIACFVDIGSPISTKQAIPSCLIPLNTVMVTNINKTSNHLLSHTIEYSDGHQYQQNKQSPLVSLILVTITVFNGMRQEVIACFVDIGDHHYIQWYETRGDCLFC
jgi:hypothetical protein